jgi:hypothetical protein
VSVSVIQGKAVSLYEDWKKHIGEGAAGTLEFQASKGWFDRFKSRACLHDILIDWRIF